MASASASVDHRFAAMGVDSMALSTDGGVTFESVPLPTGTTALLSLALAAKDVWISTQDASGDVHVFRRSDSVPSWKDVTAAPVAVTGTLVALPDGTVLDLLGQHGYWCLRPTADRWQTECAAP